jgi:hypothetical protein
VRGLRQQIAGRRALPGGAAVRFAIELLELFFDFRAGPRCIRPVEAGPGGAALQLGGPVEGGEGAGDAGEGALVGLLLAFGSLDRVPARAFGRVAEDVRVAPLELVADAGL